MLRKPELSTGPMGHLGPYKGFFLKGGYSKKKKRERERVSIRHCFITIELGYFVLTDHSTLLQKIEDIINYTTGEEPRFV